MHDTLIVLSGVLGTISKTIDEAADSDMDVHDAQLTVRLVRTEVNNMMLALGEMLKR